MPALLLVNHLDAEKPSISVHEFIALMDTDHLEALEQRVRLMREAFQCPGTVPDRVAFRDQLFLFYVHHDQWFYGMRTNPHEYLDLAWNHLRRLYGKNFDDAERNAILGRDGGLIRVIDDLTDGIVKHNIDTYIRGLFIEYLPRNYDEKILVAEELLNHYGKALLPNKKLKPYWMFSNDLETFIQGFITHLHGLHKQWRY